MSLCIIPARGGSKRIPRKNIKPFVGRPIIEWVIEIALRSECFSTVVVSTDDQEIADIALDSGAEVPFLRPRNLSDDFAPTSLVVNHAIDWLGQHGRFFEFACCLYATAPFVRPTDLEASLNLLKESELDFVFLAAQFPKPIGRGFSIQTNESLTMIDPNTYYTRTQDLPVHYFDAGQFYWGTNAAWRSQKNMFEMRAKPLLVPWFKAVDIDTVQDWELAEKIYKGCLE